MELLWHGAATTSAAAGSSSPLQAIRVIIATKCGKTGFAISQLAICRRYAMQQPDRHIHITSAELFGMHHACEPSLVMCCSGFLNM